MNVSIFHLKYKYGARSESRFAWHSRCTRCQGRCARHAPPQTFNIGMFNSVEIMLLQSNLFTMHLELWLKVVMLLFLCQWLLEFPLIGTNDWHGQHDDTCSPSLHTRLLDTGHILSPLLWKNWCNFQPKPTQSCYDYSFKIPWLSRAKLTP